MNIILIPAYIDIDYYDLQTNRTYVRGDESTNVTCVKMMKYPGLLNNLYTISEKGLIYSIMNDEYIRWSIRNNMPFINIPLNISNDKFVMTSVNIIDLMAYNFIRYCDSYIERGYKPIVLDRDYKNMKYNNIVYGLPSVI